MMFSVAKDPKPLVARKSIGEIYWFGSFPYYQIRSVYIRIEAFKEKSWAWQLPVSQKSMRDVEALMNYWKTQRHRRTVQRW